MKIVCWSRWTPSSGNKGPQMQNFASLWPVPYPAFCAIGGIDCESSCPCSLSIAKFWDEVPLVKLRVNGV